MKRIFFVFMAAIIICLVGCGKEKQNVGGNGGSQYEKDSSQYEQQKKDNAGSDFGRGVATAGASAGGAAAGGSAGFVAGATIGATIGSVVPGAGTLAGASIGAAIGSVVPGAGTAAGATIGAVAGGIAGAVGGGVAAGSAIYSLANGEVSEYINVETRLNYMNDTTGKNMPFVFGSSGQKNYATPTFAKKDKVKLIVEMNTQMIPEKIKKASKRQKSPDLLIPVEIQIDKSSIEEGTLSITYNGGSIPEDAVNTPEIVDDKQHYFFFIKNDPYANPIIQLKFSPAGVGEAKIGIIYGKPDYKIVLSSCDITQFIEFTDSNG